MRLSLYLRIFFITLAVMLPAPALFNYYCDPYQVFHRSYLPNTGVSSNQRFQNPGLVRHWLAKPEEGFDSILVGSSLSANFTGVEIQRHLNWTRTLPLLMDGSGSYEHATVTKLALSTGRVKHILWELYPYSYYSAQRGEAATSEQFPFYLYNLDPWDDVHYLFNISVFSEAVLLWLGYTDRFSHPPDKVGYRGYTTRAEEHWRALNQPNHIALLQSVSAPILSPHGESTRPTDYPELQQIVFPVIDQLCALKIETIFYIPPLSKAAFRTDPVYADRSIYLARTLAEKIATCPQIRLFAFDTMSFTTNLVHYQDREHYLPHINTLILESISQGKNQITRDNVQAYEDNFRDLLNRGVLTSDYSDSRPMPRTFTAP